MEELNKDQIIQDLYKWATLLVDMDNKIHEMYKDIQHIFKLAADKK